MGVLNNARTMYVGSTPVDAVYIGGKRVWVDDSVVVEALVDDEPTPFGVAFDFPSSPAENAEYTATNGIVYVYKAPRWVVKAVPTGVVDWDDITDKPATFPPSTHTHLWADITDKPTTFAPNAHAHAIADVTNLQTTLDNKQPIDADLTALAAVSGTNTIYYRSAANTWTAVTMGGNMTFTGGTLNSTGGSGQPADADLTAIAALATTGIVRRTAADTWTASNAVTNAEQATMAAYTLKANNTSGAAVPADITIAGLTTKATPTVSDWVLISDTAASAAFKKAAWPTGGSGTPGGATTNVQFNNAGAFGGTASLTWTSPALSIGAIGAGAQIKLTGNTSGVVTFQPATSSTSYNFNLPSNAGTSGQPLLSGGGGSTAQSYSTLGVAHGGTGNTTAAAALTALGGVPLTGNSTITGDVLFKYPSAPTTDGYVYFGTLSQWIGFAGPEFFISHKMTMDMANPSIYLRKSASGQNNGIYGYTTSATGGTRWALVLGDSISETGANVGSNFGISRYNDAGAYLGIGLNINRATGDASISGNFYCGSNYISTIGVISAGGASAAFVLASTSYYFNTAGIVAAAGYKPGGGAWADSSDIRIKTIKGDYTHGLAEILQLKPVRYEFNGNEYSARAAEEAKKDKSTPISDHATVLGKEFIGLIAQDAEIPMPETVTLTAGYIDGEAVNDLRILDVSPVIFALVNAVKELTARVEQLESAVP